MLLAVFGVWFLNLHFVVSFFSNRIGKKRKEAKHLLNDEQRRRHEAKENLKKLKNFERERKNVQALRVVLSAASPPSATSSRSSVSPVSPVSPVLPSYRKSNSRHSNNLETKQDRLESSRSRSRRLLPSPQPKGSPPTSPILRGRSRSTMLNIQEEVKKQQERRRKMQNEFSKSTWVVVLFCFVAGVTYFSFPC